MFRLIALALFVTAAGTSLVLRGRAERAGARIPWSHEHPVVMVGLRAFGLATWLGVVLGIAWPRALAWASMGLGDGARWLGVACCLVASPMLVWTLRTIGTNITQTVLTREGHELVTRGPYAIVRHPLYTFGTLFMLGMGLTLDSGLVCVGGLGGLAFLLLRLPGEEARLIDAFGDDYRDYMRRVGGLVPRPSR